MVTLKDINKERFLSYIAIIPEHSCWEWTAGVGSNGYGMFWINSFQRSIGAHIISFILFNNKKILKDLCVLHTCDNRSCVNPKHLWLGTKKDNAIDCVNKGRHTDNRGEKCGTSKLTEKQVLEIRKKYKPYKYSTARLAKEYGITDKGIWRIIARETWAHI